MKHHPAMHLHQTPGVPTRFRQERTTFAAPTCVTNATSKEPLRLAAIWSAAPRPGSQDAAALKSRGIGC